MVADMSTYYYLLNDTKRQRVHLDNHTKRSSIAWNEAVQHALCNYMLENVGDALRLCGDSGWDGADYEDKDLLSYKFREPEVLETIVETLNIVYGCEKYAIENGVGTSA